MKKLNFDYNLMKKLYIDQEKSCIDIANLLGCSQGSVSLYLKKYEIKSRPFSKKGVIPWNKGLHYELPHLKKFQFKKGDKSVWKGKKLSMKHRRNLSVSHSGELIFTGFKSTENVKIRGSKEYKDWRNKVFRKDSYICQISGQVGLELEAHHIINFSSNKKERLNIKNGITMSKDIHDLFHTIYGKRNNTLEQLEEFKQKAQR